MSKKQKITIKPEGADIELKGEIELSGPPNTGSKYRVDFNTLDSLKYLLNAYSGNRRNPKGLINKALKFAKFLDEHCEELIIKRTGNKVYYDFIMFSKAPPEAKRKTEDFVNTEFLQGFINYLASFLEPTRPGYIHKSRELVNQTLKAPDGQINLFDNLPLNIREKIKFSEDGLTKPEAEIKTEIEYINDKGEGVKLNSGESKVIHAFSEIMADREEGGALVLKDISGKPTKT